MIQKSILKRTFTYTVIFIICLVCIEIAFRLVFAMRIDNDVLLFGTNKCKGQNKDDSRATIHRNIKEGYFKYFPNETKTYTDEFDKIYSTKTNNHGFRGRNFSDKKDPDTIRIIALGASTTYGLFNSDSTTYPYILENMLNRENAFLKYEVINCGVPHFQSHNEVALFYNELINYSPDIVLFFDGLSDCEINKQSSPSEARSFLRSHLISFRYITEIFKQYNKAEVEGAQKEISENYINNIDSIYQGCIANKIKLIVCNQRARSLNDLKSNDELTFQEDVNYVNKKFLKNKLNKFEAGLLIHDNLMKNLKKWSLKNNVAFVDFINYSDNKGNCLVSWGHMNNHGNVLLAEVLSKEILNIYTNPN